MPDFQIKITTPIELAGAKALEEQLERDIGKAKALGENFSELEKKLTSTKSAIAGASDEAKKGGEEGFKILGHGAHGAHAALHALGDAFPGVQQLARFLASGFTASVGIAAAAFIFLKDKIKEFGEALDVLDTPSARGEWAEKIRDHAREAAVESALLAEKIRELAVAQENLEKITDRIIAAQRQRAGDEKEIAGLEREVALARLALQEKLGQITPDQAIKIRLQIDEKAFQDELKSKLALIEAELDARLTQMNQNRFRQSSSEDRASVTAAAAKQAEEAQIKNQGKIEQDKKQLEAEKAALEEAQKKYAAVNKPYRVDNLITDQTGTLADLISGKQGVIRSLEQSVRSGEAQSTALATAAAVAKAQAEKAAADYEEASKSAREIKTTVETLQAELKAAQAKNTVLSSLHAEKTRLNRATETGEGGPELTASGWDLQTRVDAAVDQAREAIYTHGANDSLQTLLELTHRMADLIHNPNVSDNLAGQIQSLERKVEALEGSLKANFSSVGG